MDLTRTDTKHIAEALSGMIQYKKAILGLLSQPHRAETEAWISGAGDTLKKVLAEN